ncbi:MAG: minor capsid protein [Treponemataceae bacterium]|nr:minor capsid protein [Treponemataceae bacterium]
MNNSGTITFTVNANFNTAAIQKKLDAAIHKAQIKLDAQIIADSNFYCPLKTGALQKSAITNTVLGSGKIIWRTPYARVQYYGVNFDRSKDPNPNACAKWFEAAKAHKLEQWERLVNDTIKNS